MVAPARGETIATYIYTDEDDSPLYRKVRLEPKDFYTQRYQRGKWVNGLPADWPHVPYYASLLSKAQSGGERVYITEGEKDADRLVAEGLIATTFVSGWLDNYADWFADVDVVILVDNDESGRKQAAERAAVLAPIARCVRVVELPDLPPKGDVSDWLDAGRERWELATIVDETPTWKPKASDKNAPLAREMLSTRASEITPEHVAWLWPGRLPARRLTLFGGKPDEGKSAVTYDLAARFSTGSPLPDGHRPEPINVAILSAEDDPSDTIVPRLIAAGANLERIMILDDIADEAGIVRPFTLPDAIPELGDKLEAENVSLLIVDTLSAYISTSVDTHKESPVRAMLKPLATMARKTGCAVLAIRHLRKGSTDDPRDAGSGSIAFTAAARMEWVVGRDPQDAGRHILAGTKHNISGEVPSLAYRLTKAESEWDTVAVSWNGTSNVTAKELTATLNDREHDQLDEAIAFLTELLGDGAISATEAGRQANEAEIAKATLRRAKSQLGVKSRKLSSGTWVWELPKQDAHEGAQGETDEHLEHHPCSRREEEVSSLLGLCIEGAQDAQDAHAYEDVSTLILSAFSGAEEVNR